MFHFDYSWDLYSDKLILDEELNTDRLGWENGDYFRLVEVNGKKMLLKVGDIEKFLIQGANKNEQISRMVGWFRSPDKKVFRKAAVMA